MGGAVINRHKERKARTFESDGVRGWCGGRRVRWGQREIGHSLPAEARRRAERWGRVDGRVR